MRPDFQCDPTARNGPEDFLQRFRTRTNSLFQLYLTGLIHDAVPAVAIAQIQSDGQFLLRNIPALRCRSDANLLHCRSPFYLCFEHVDNLGAYTASRRRPAFSSHLITNSFPSSSRFGRICRQSEKNMNILGHGLGSTPSAYREGKILVVPSGIDL